MDLRRWGTTLPILWSAEMRLSCGAACGRLMERELGLAAVSRSCRCWRSAAGEKAGSVERGEGRTTERAEWEGCCGEGGEDQWWVKGKMRAGLGRLARLKGKICGNRAALVCFGRDDRRKAEMSGGPWLCSENNHQGPRGRRLFPLLVWGAAGSLVRDQR